MVKDGLDEDLYQWEKDDLVNAQMLLERILKTTSVDQTTFQKLMYGLIDTFASNNKVTGYHEKNVNASYQAIMTFAADRLLMSNKPRTANRLIKEVAEQYTKRNEFIKDNIKRRTDEYMSVGNHPFTDFKPEYLGGYSEDFKKTEDALRYFDSKLITQKQKKLTSYANGIKKELLHNDLRKLLSRTQDDTVTSAVTIIENINQCVIHAKERRKRKEQNVKLATESRKRLCEHVIAKFCGLKKLPLVELVNLIIYYDSLPSRYKRGTDYRIDTEYLLDNIDACNVDNILRFKLSLIDSMKNALAYMVERMAWEIQINGEYEKVEKPSDAIVRFMADWRDNRLSKIADKHCERFKHISNVIEQYNAKNAQ